MFDSLTMVPYSFFFNFNNNCRLESFSTLLFDVFCCTLNRQTENCWTNEKEWTECMLMIITFPLSFIRRSKCPLTHEENGGKKKIMFDLFKQRRKKRRGKEKQQRLNRSNYPLVGELLWRLDGWLSRRILRTNGEFDDASLIIPWSTLILNIEKKKTRKSQWTRRSEQSESDFFTHAWFDLFLLD